MMDIRWMAIVTGFVVDYTVTALILLAWQPDSTFFDAPTLQRLDHVIALTLALLSTGIGGFVAARLARQRHELHGLLVGVIGILLGQLQVLGGAPAPPRLFVVVSAIGCGVGALGGLLGRVLAPAAHPLDR